MLFVLLVIVYFVLFALLSWRKLDWALYFVIFALPSYLIRFQLFGIPMTLLEGMILTVFVVWIIRKTILSCHPGGPRRKCRGTIGSRFHGILSLRSTSFQNDNIKSFLLPIGLFLLASIIAMVTSPDLRAAAGVWKAYFVEPILFLIVFVDTIHTKRQVINVLWALGASIIIPGIIAVYQKFTGLWIPVDFWQAAETRRVTSVYGYPNAIGLYFAPIVVGGIAMIVHKVVEYIRGRLSPIEHKKAAWKIPLFVLLTTLGTLSIIFAQSKGAVLAVLIGLIFFAVFWKGKRIVYISLLIILFISSAVFAPQLYSTAGTSTVTGGGSLEVRIDQWGEAWEMLKTRPLLGAGLSGYQTRVAPFHEKEYIEIFLYPHNIILNFWSEVGLLGLIAFIWIVVLFFMYARYVILKTTNSERHIPYAITGVMIALLAHGLVDAPYFKNDLSVLFWVLIGLMVTNHFQQKSKTLDKR